MNGFFWIYLFLLELFAAYTVSKSEQRRTLLYAAGCGVLILFFALQDASVSVDTAEYMLQYSLIPGMSLTDMLGHKFEIGYNLLCKLLSVLFEGDRVLLVAMSLLILVPFFIWFRRESDEPMMALMCFLALGMYYNSMVYLRQFCAMAIMTFGYRYVRQRRLLPFLLTLLLAMSFHKSAALLAVIYVFTAVPVNKWLLLGGALGSAALGILGKPIIRLVYRYIYSNYREDEFFYSMGGFNMLLVLWIFVLIVYWLMRDRLEEPKIKILFLMTLTAAVIQPVTFSYFFWCRIVLYFRVAMVMLVPELYATVFRRKENNVLLSLLAKKTPKLHGRLMDVYDKPWFRTTVQLAMFAVLFFWYVTELDGTVYRMAPV